MIDYSVRSGVIIKTPLNKELEVWIPITNNGDVDEHQIVYDGEYAPIVENNGEFLTQDEYWGEYGLI